MYLNISRDILGGFQNKCVDLRPGELFTMADIAGPGLITRIWVTLPRRINPGSLRNLVLKMYWDGEEEPSVVAPLGDFFGTTFERPRDYTSAYLAITSGACLPFFPMPFPSRALITIYHGLNNILPPVYDGTAYRYQQEPHEPFAGLPGSRERHVAGTCRNRLIMAAPLSYAALVWYLFRRLKSRPSG